MCTAIHVLLALFSHQGSGGGGVSLVGVGALCLWWSLLSSDCTVVHVCVLTIGEKGEEDDDSWIHIIYYVHVASYKCRACILLMPTTDPTVQGIYTHVYIYDTLLLHLRLVIREVFIAQPWVSAFTLRFGTDTPTEESSIFDFPSLIVLMLISHGSTQV